jgi:integrase
MDIEHKFAETNAALTRSPGYVWHFWFCNLTRKRLRRSQACAPPRLPRQKNTPPTQPIKKAFWRFAQISKPLVFPDAKGRPMRSSDLLRTGLHAALRRAKLRQVRFHDLRHSFASNLLGAGTDIVTVSKALGHANVHITLTTYAHAIPRERQGRRGCIGAIDGAEWKQNGNIDP